MTCKVLLCARTKSRLALVGIIVSSLGWGQTITSTIVGQATDPSGAGVLDARVTAKNAETNIATEGASDSSGTYTIPQLQPGIYDVTVTKRGFVTQAVTAIRVLSSQTVRVDIKLELGAMQQTVYVSGEVALIHTDTQTISSSISTRIMGDLPKSSQSIDALIGLVPGAATTGGNAMIAGSGYWGGNDWNLNCVILFEFICIRFSLLAVKYWVALYVNPVVDFRRDVAAEAVLLVVSRDLLVRCIGFK